jgi:hypothetical protein
MTPLAIGAGVVAGAVIGAVTVNELRNQRREAVEGGRTVFYEPDRVIIRDPGGQAYVRGNDLNRFRYGARDIRTETVGGDTRTVVIRPDGSEVITVVGADGRLLRRIRRDRSGREIIIIDNSYRDPARSAASMSTWRRRGPHSLQSLHRRFRGGIAGRAV